MDETHISALLAAIERSAESPHAAEKATKNKKTKYLIWKKGRARFYKVFEDADFEDGELDLKERESEGCGVGFVLLVVSESQGFKKKRN